MAGYNPPGGGGSDSLHAMLARMQAQRNAQQNSDEQFPVNDILSRFTSYNQGANPQDYYGHSNTDSPVTGLDDFPPPAAPTPPSNNYSHSHHPTGPTGLGPIGSMPSNVANKPDQSTNLLNLLKFSGPGATAPSHPSPPGNASQSFEPQSNNPPPIHAPVPMTGDPSGLLANLMKGNPQNEASRAEAQGSIQSTWSSGPPSMDTQTYLLNLLHRPKPAQNDPPSTIESSQPPTLTPQSGNGSVEHHKEYTSQNQHFSDSISQDVTPMPFRFGSRDHVESPPAKFEYHSPASQHSQQDSGRRYNKPEYASPLEAFGTASPQNVASKSSTPGGSGHMPTEIPVSTSFKVVKKTPSVASSSGLGHDYKRPSSHRSHIASPEHIRERFDMSPLSAAEQGVVPNITDAPRGEIFDEEKNTETVAEAITGLAEQADKEAQEAIERAEHEEDSAEAAARDIKSELQKEENARVLEEAYSAEVAQTIRDIVDDVAQGPVADSWESAEADEIVVIEETPNPVKVYNFPMKPWISITMLETEEPRPQFRDDVVLDIARLKKEFDQIDRNLVTATETYMVYGMSKAGGLRVIRQDDGKDAKLFTDTKDRIFNVAMSSTPLDSTVTPKESIIGTGVGGTVYYVQIKNGDKDHLEDANPEQYGFILPPLVISQEGGGENGGVLKTRARTSSTHPEFFAVGRGKTINIVWPSYVVENGIFRPDQDRVVDTERLYKECSLRISTGKAGKDFTFSQDDTTIVSLDKSGRVKFWDVRDLTAADENSDPRAPMPAHTSLEVKEPLMTLNTTPEGEKAWPTSVLLLDKQRPYQKGWALRYMIVGMKQNHTLQLWDLALGKPVQEFNLPHAKESDPVCSVMYHPPSGMIVVGHPTRNSIYFLHLSAPKYTIKGLSQVEYVQKLVAKDPSIPEPDSTAVISGVREYSFANKGVLRSLDLLVNPATASDNDEQSLFELYAMHSKGVTGVIVKQSELGWSKDNKVIDGVNAEKVGMVKIAKLKELPNALVSEPQSLEEQTPLPLRVRPAKETPPPQLSSVPSIQEQLQKANESIHSAGQSERKEAIAPVAPANQGEKAEKKARKKREKAAAAAERLATDNAQINGNSQAAKADPTPSKQSDLKPSASSFQPVMSQDSIQSTVKQIVSSLGEKLGSVIANEFKGHQDVVNAEFRSRDETFAKNQQSLLEKVSNVLNNNIQVVLTNTINDQFGTDVVPVLSALVTKTITDQIDGKMTGRVSHSIQNQLQKLIPTAVNQALQKPEFAKAISDKVANSVAHSVAHEVEKSLRSSFVATMTPLINDTAITASRSIVQEVQGRTTEQFAELEQRHIADSKKIDQLTALVTGLSETISTMATTQAHFQDGLLKSIKLQQHPGSRDRDRDSREPREPQNHIPSAPQTIQSHHPQQSMQQSLQSQSYLYGSPTADPSLQMVPFQANSTSTREPQVQHMIANVASFVERGDHEAGLIRWIQQNHQAEVFDEYLSKLNPAFLQDLPALVLLSVASVLAEHLKGPLLQTKLDWVEVVLHILSGSLGHIEPQVRDVIPKCMTTYLSKFDGLYQQIAPQSPSDPLLTRLTKLITMSTRIMHAVQPPNPNYYSPNSGMHDLISHESSRIR